MAPLGSFSRAEVQDFLYTLWSRKMAPGLLDGDIEELHYRLPTLPLDQIPLYADSLVPPGRRGRIKLVLNPPAYARGIALLAWLLRSIDRE